MVGPDQPLTQPPAPQTQPADNPYQRMARGIMKQRFNRSIPAGASRGGAIATGIGGVLDSAVDGWAERKAANKELF